MSSCVAGSRSSTAARTLRWPVRMPFSAPRTSSLAEPARSSTASCARSRVSTVARTVRSTASRRASGMSRRSAIGSRRSPRVRPVSAPIHLRPAAELAERVLLPGDPHRALAVAQVVLDQPRMFNHTRGLWGYTGHGARRRAAVGPVHRHGRPERRDRGRGADRPRRPHAHQDRHLRRAGRGLGARRARGGARGARRRRHERRAVAARSGSTPDPGLDGRAGARRRPAGDGRVHRRVLRAPRGRRARVGPGRRRGGGDGGGHAAGGGRPPRRAGRRAAGGERPACRDGERRRLDVEGVEAAGVRLGETAWAALAERRAG